MSIWEQIVSVSVVGTERQEPDLTPASGALGGLFETLSVGDSERRLLSAIAAASLHRLAGAIPDRDGGPIPSVCAADERHACGVRSEQHLALMLEGQFAEALPEWLAVAASASLLAPPSLLPGLLDLAIKDVDLREAINPLLGERGRWLARQNPDWSLACAIIDEALWETEGRAVRRAMLRAMRARTPGRARELLASTWDKESFEDRAAFVGFFREGLTMDDEPFLEAALDDRRKEVRLAAAELLACLPGSRLQARMLERLRPLLTFKPKGLLRKARLEVTLPAERDAAMARDGIEDRAQQGTGERASLLVQMLASVAPGAWCEMWNTTPTALLGEIDCGEWKKVMVEGWKQATLRSRDPKWAETFVKLSLSESAQYYDLSLLAVLPPDRQAAIALDMLKPFGENTRALAVLSQIDKPWTSELSRAVFDTLVPQLTTLSSTGGMYVLHRLLRSLSLYLHPSLVERAATELAARGEAEHWTPVEDGVLALLRFRREMLGDLAAGR